MLWIITCLNLEWIKPEFLFFFSRSKIDSIFQRYSNPHCLNWRLKFRPLCQHHDSTKEHFYTEEPLHSSEMRIKSIKIICLFLRHVKISLPTSMGSFNNRPLSASFSSFSSITQLTVKHILFKMIEFQLRNSVFESECSTTAAAILKLCYDLHLASPLFSLSMVPTLNSSSH